MPDPNTNIATGSGATVSISSDGSTYKTFGAVSSATGPTMTRGTVDVTTLNSYDNNYKMKEVLADFIEGGDLSVNGFFTADDEGRNAVDTAFYGDSEVYIKFVLSSRIGKTIVFKGIPTSYQPVGEVSPSSGIAFTFAIRVTAKPTISAST